MPLPASASRRLVHRRVIVCHGFERSSTLIDVDATVTDTRTAPTRYGERTVPAGAPLNQMGVRLTVDTALTITQCAAVSDQGPHATCPSVAASFAALEGQSLNKGFTRTVRGLLSSGQGCVHIVDLLGPAATTVFQSMNRLWRRLPQDTAAQTARRAGFLVDTCHVWSSDGALVKKEFPERYTGK